MVSLTWSREESQESEMNHYVLGLRLSMTHLLSVPWSGTQRQAGYYGMKLR